MRLYYKILKSEAHILYNVYKLFLLLVYVQEVFPRFSGILSWVGSCLFETPTVKYIENPDSLIQLL